MKCPLRLLAPLLILAGSLRAAAPYPTALLVDYKQVPQPVVRILGTDPVVQIDGKEKRIRRESLFRVRRAAAFGEGWVELAGASLQFYTPGRNSTVRSGFLRPSSDEGALPGAGSPQALKGAPAPLPDTRGLQGIAYFEATLKSREPLAGGFIAVLVFPPPPSVFGPGLNYKPTKILVHDLPSLPANREVRVSFSATLATYQAGNSYLVQVFDASGHEVRTGQSALAAEFYRILARVDLADRVAAYLKDHAGVNHEPVPDITIPPAFPGHFAKPDQRAYATLGLSAEGIVTSVTIDGVEDQGLRESFTDSLTDWLFMPKLKAGRPVACKVKIPLQF